MKKQYMQPTAAIVAVNMGALLQPASSIQNTNGDVQTPIKPNDDSNFEAGSKDHQTNLWDKWDE